MTVEVLTNAVAVIDVCVVHLRVPRGVEGQEKQMEQNRALLRWSMRHLAKNPKANLIILGDFNEGVAPGKADQALAVLFKAKPPMIDSFDFLKGKTVTHFDGNAYDRILLSEGLVKGLAGLKFDSVQIQRHSHGSRDLRQMYTDHFPVSVWLR